MQLLTKPWRLGRTRLGLAIVSIAVIAAAACGRDGTTPTQPDQIDRTSAACRAVNFGPAPQRIELTARTPATMQTLGNGAVTARFTAEIAVRGTTAYTTTWGSRGGMLGNTVYVWDVSGNGPALADSVMVSGGFSTLGDVAVSDDGKLLVVATERTPGSIVILDLADPRHPKEVGRFTNSDTFGGVHTAEIGRVNGKLYGFLAIDPNGSSPARVSIVDLSDLSSPRQVYTKIAGAPYLHDTFARDGLLFVALWNTGMEIWDLGGCGASGGGSPENPRVIGGVKTVGGEVHNIWWYHDASNGSKSYAFVGEEGPGTIGSSSYGDVHVVDISDPAAPREVAFYHVAGAGTHNFSVDEANGILYAAYYNGGVRALDVRGDLGSCTPAQQVTIADNVTRCDLRLMGREIGVGLLDQGRPVYVWGVQYLGGFVYASDMLNGIWKLRAVTR